MWEGLLIDRTNKKLERRNLINEDELNHEPVPLTWQVFQQKWRVL